MYVGSQGFTWSMWLRYTSGYLLFDLNFNVSPSCIRTPSVPVPSPIQTQANGDPYTDIPQWKQNIFHIYSFN